MRVKDARLIGLFGGLFLGGLRGACINIIILFVGICGVSQYFTRKQVLTSPLGGLLAGIAAGYLLRELLF